MRAGFRATLMAVFAVAILCLPTVADACPFCDGGASGINEVKEAIFDNNFWFTLMAAALPFVMLVVVAAIIHGPPIARPEAKSHSQGSST